MNKVPHCSECEYMRMYDYTYKNHYCDHEDRIDDMGKLSMDNLMDASPEWCPLRYEKESKHHEKRIKY